MKYLYILILLITLDSCFLKVASLEITDKYISVKKPGQSWALVEVDAIKLDSIFEYPKIEKFVKSYVVIEDKSGNRILNNSSIKMFFDNHNKHYKWKIYTDFYLQHTSLTDNIIIKPNTWYNLSSTNCSYELYFYWSGKEGDYIVKEKPKPGAW